MGSSGDERTETTQTAVPRSPVDADDALLAAIVRSHSEAVVVIADDGTITYANEAVRVTGWAPEDIVGRTAFDLLHPDELARAGAALVASTSSARPAAGLVRVLSPSGEALHFEISPGSLRTVDGRTVTFATLHDTRLNVAHWNTISALLSGSTTAQALELMALGVSTEVDGPLGIAFDDAGERLCVGSLPPALVGVRPDGTVDQRPDSPFTTAQPGDPVGVVTHVSQMPEDLRVAASRLGLEWSVVVAVHDPGSELPAFLVQWPPSPEMAALLATSVAVRPAEMVTIALERRHQVERLEWFAWHDQLTGLANRAGFIDATDAAVAGGIVCYLDLDGFKEINDTYGHVFGDELLGICADRLRAAARVEDVVARLGGDEFAVLCRPPLDDDHARLVGDRLVETLGRPMVIGGTTVQVGASVGIAHLEPGGDPDAAISAADRALYEVKRTGKGRWATA